MSRSNTQAVLELIDVTKSYVEGDGTELPVLDIEHFAVAPAEQLAIIGRSGCGKTTLLHVIAGICHVDGGHVWLDGIDLARLSEAARDRVRAAKIGYVFQTFNLLPGFTALENVQIGMTFARRKKDDRRARELLERVGLSHRLHHRPGQLSVGEQQRVAVARALVNRPRLILADEPTANVDPANQQAMIDLIRGTCSDEKTSLVLVTHSMEVVGQFDRVERLDRFNRVLQRIESGANGAPSGT